MGEMRLLSIETANGGEKEQRELISDSHPTNLFPPITTEMVESIKPSIATVSGISIVRHSVTRSSRSDYRPIARLPATTTAMVALISRCIAMEPGTCNRPPRASAHSSGDCLLTFQHRPTTTAMEKLTQRSF